VPGNALAEATLARARAGDEDAFRELTEPHRRELQVHCYPMLGSLQDAEDLVQETLLAAWRGLEAFEGRASVRAPPSSRWRARAVYKDGGGDGYHKPSGPRSDPERARAPRS
jgi:Sigma-70 region 2